MESSALTLSKSGMALRDSVCKTVDTNLLLVNGIIVKQLRTPTLDMEFLCSCLDSRLPINHHCEDYRVLKEYLQVPRRVLLSAPL